jgi:hypothetical protein
MHCHPSTAQERAVKPYIGVSGSIGVGPGWGTEAGIAVHPFYVGLEYGQYTPFGESQTYDPVPNGIPPPKEVPNSHEQFIGIHLGFDIIRDSARHISTFVGIVVLQSYQPREKWDTTLGWMSFTQSYLNVGPDVRFAGLDDGHIYGSFALTIRRGFKIGVGYLF